MPSPAARNGRKAICFPQKYFALLRTAIFEFEHSTTGLYFWIKSNKWYTLNRNLGDLWWAWALKLQITRHLWTVYLFTRVCRECQSRCKHWMTQQWHLLIASPLQKLALQERCYRLQTTSLQNSSCFTHLPAGKKNHCISLSQTFHHHHFHRWTVILLTCKNGG